MENNLENIRRSDVVLADCDSDGKPIPGTEKHITILWNRKVISEKEVKGLIHSGVYEFDNRIIVTTPVQADHLRGITKKEMAETEMFQRVCSINPTFVNLES